MKSWKPAITALIAGTMLLSTYVPQARAEATGTGQDVNLALNRSYSTESTITDSVFHTLQTNSFPDNGTKLTDGEIGPESWKANGPWVGYLRQDDHHITIDLGSTQTVHKLNAWFLQDKAAGIYFPKTVTFELSNNGKAWSKAGTADSAIPMSTVGALKQNYSLDGLNAAARYVRVTFHADIYAFLSEIEAMGLLGIRDGAKKPQPTPPDKPDHQNFPRAGSKQAGGKHAEMLIYSGYTTTPGLPQWNAADFIPHVAYVDQDQQIRDFMFDSFLFLPLGTAPSGAAYGDKATKADWTYYADQLFSADHRLQGLDQAVGQVKTALQDKKYKAKVVIAIPFPGISSNWGDGLDFDPAHVGEDQSLANRTQAIQWYVDYILAKWRDAGYTNLELNGFYWYKEGIDNVPSTKDEQLVRNASAIVHQAGPFSFDWIPANQNPGFSTWKDYGFDTALMQPNSAFAAGLPADRLENNAILARKYGLGVEMEMHWNVTRTDELGKTYRNNYYDYLDAAYRYHYQNSFLAWYANVDTLLVSSKSGNPEIRELYDQTYRFINGTYKPRL